MMVDKDKSEKIKKKIFDMASKVEESVHMAIEGLMENDLHKLEKTEILEKEVNSYHLELDDDCFKYIALKQPVAKELRFILTCMKANTDLERIGDQARNIAQTSTILIQNKIPLMDEIKVMSHEVLLMLHESLDSFLKLDFDLANSVFKREKKVNEMKTNIFKKIMSDLKNTSQIETYIEMILVSRNLERIGDHAQNISEYLIFLEEGKDIRHSKFLNEELNYVRKKT